MNAVALSSVNGSVANVNISRIVGRSYCRGGIFILSLPSLALTVKE
jgi:hypothetical protein